MTVKHCERINKGTEMVAETLEKQKIHHKMPKEVSK